MMIIVMLGSVMTMTMMMMVMMMMIVVTMTMVMILMMIYLIDMCAAANLFRGKFRRKSFGFEANGKKLRLV